LGRQRPGLPHSVQCIQRDPQLVYTRSEWKLLMFHQLVKNPARVKQVFDENQIGGGKFLNNIKNP